MSTLYLIREMKLIGAKFSIYTEIPLHENAQFVYERGKLRKVVSKGETYENTRYYRLSEKPLGYNMDTTSLLPYFAKVKQDLPGSCKRMEAAVYEKCQLTTQFPNGYLVFQDLKTGKHLKIALNSHTYEPIN